MSPRWRFLLPHLRRREDHDMQAELAALAEIAGKRELGNVTLALENARAAWGWTWLESFLADVRYAIRSLRKQPSFAVVAVTSLALGIAANAAIFSLMDALLWRDLPVRDPERLVIFANSSGSYFGYNRFAESAGKVMESVSAVSVSTLRLDTGGGPGRGRVGLVTGNFFGALGINTEIGRPIIPADDRRSDPTAVAVLSHAYWQKAYGGGAVVGRTIRVERSPFKIVGVAPAEFFGVTVGEVPDVWLPITAVASIFPGPNWLDAKNTNFLTIVGRLRSGINAQQAAAALTPVNIQIDIERNGRPANETDRRRLFEEKLRLEPAAKGISFLRNRFSKPLRLVFWMVAIGLLMACVNVMSLGFARADERRKELTVRLAIGASRWRITRQLLTESLVIALLSGLIGLVFRKPLADALLRLVVMWDEQPAKLALQPHSGMLLFVVGISIAVALLSGLLPAKRASRGDVLPGLQQGSRTVAPATIRRLLGRTAAVVQMALSLVLVAGACLFAYSLHQLRQFDAGLNRNRLLVMEVNPVDAGYQAPQLNALDTRLRERLASVPGVQAVSFSQNGIYSSGNFNTRFDADGYVNMDDNEHYSIYDSVGPHFFKALGGHMIAGRDFNERDTAAAPKVAIVTHAFALAVFKDQSAIGRNLYVATSARTSLAFQIVGEVQDVRNDVRRPEAMFYLCELQTETHAFSTRFLVRTRLDPAAVIPALRSAVRSENAALQIDQIDSATDLFDRTLSTDRLVAALSWGFGALAILLAAVGTYGLLSFDITRRTAEIGIRMAVGAQKADVMALVLWEVAFVCGVGIVLGSTAALAMAKLVEGLVFQMKAGDPLIEIAAALILVAVALGAAWFPARRAARLDPMVALRSE